jgi:hypothetical protein
MRLMDFASDAHMQKEESHLPPQLLCFGRDVDCLTLFLCRLVSRASPHLLPLTRVKPAKELLTEI